MRLTDTGAVGVTQVICRTGVPELALFIPLQNAVGASGNIRRAGRIENTDACAVIVTPVICRTGVPELALFTGFQIPVGACPRSH